MKELVEIFTNQLREALTIGRNANLTPSKNTIQNVVITGLGGSGIGGKIVAQLVADKSPVPFFINNDYSLPAFVNENTLVIASSFSGNTEETLAALKIAQDNNAEIACITSGGELEKIAKANNYNCIILPQGDSPRAMLCYSLTQQFFLLNHYGLIDDKFQNDIENAIELIDNNLDQIKSEAHTIADFILNKTAIIYCDARFEGVAVRWRQQLNENAKVLCWHHVYPEMNHNELVGWAGGDNEKAVIVLRNDDDNMRTQKRMDISKDIFEEHTDVYIEAFSAGISSLEKALYLINLGDWVSVYLADMRNVDAVEVNVISHLKGELAKLK